MASNYNPSIVTSGLVLALDAGNTKSYPGSGTTWTDLSGNGNTGTLSNGPTYSSSNGGAIVFDGTNDYVATATATALGLSSVATPFTISSWFKTSGSGEYYLFDNYDNNGLLEDISFRVDGGVMEIYMHASTSGDTGTLRFGSGYNNNAWHNFVMTWNGSNTISGYADGTLIGSTTSYTFSGSFDSGTAFWIGQRPGSPAVWFPGSIAVTHFYNTALTAAQVLQNFNALRGRFGL